MADAAAAMGPLDVLVLQRRGREPRPARRRTDDDWQRVLDVNLKGPFLCMQHAIPHMVRRRRRVGDRPRARTLGLIVAPRYPAYCASARARSSTCASRPRSSTRPTACASTWSRRRRPTPACSCGSPSRRPTPRRSARRSPPTSRWAGSAPPTTCATPSRSSRSDALDVHQRRGHPARRRARGPEDRDVIDGLPRARRRRARRRAAATCSADVLRPGRRRSTCPPTTPYEPCGDLDVLADQLEHGFDAPSYLRAMDAQGIDAVVLYPSIGLFVPFLPELDAGRVGRRVPGLQRLDRRATARPTRRASPASASCPLADVGRAVGRGPSRAPTSASSACWCGRTTSTAATSATPRTTRCTTRCRARAWCSPSTRGWASAGPTIGRDRFSQRSPPGTAARTRIEQMAAMASLAARGRARTPPATSRVAFLESGTGWLPYWLAPPRRPPRVDGRDRVRGACRSRRREYFAASA